MFLIEPNDDFYAKLVPLEPRPQQYADRLARRALEDNPHLVRLLAEPAVIEDQLEAALDSLDTDLYPVFRPKRWENYPSVVN